VPTARAFFTNVSVPMPLHRKLRPMFRDQFTKVWRRQNCCGHSGESGCLRGFFGQAPLPWLRNTVQGSVIELHRGAGRARGGLSCYKSRPMREGQMKISPWQISRRGHTEVKEL